MVAHGESPGQVADFLKSFWQAAGGADDLPAQVRITGAGSLPSVFPVTEFATASVAAAGLAAASLVRAVHGKHDIPEVQVDRRLASFWFGMSVRPQGWNLPPAWDAVAGDYPALDGWIRLHTNAPRHRDAALAVLQVAPERTAVAQAVSAWRAEELESAVVARGGCASAMRSWQQWQHHDQGRAVLSEPLLAWSAGAIAAQSDWRVDARRPLSGIRVLDMTRVLAGPVATRLLAGLGADVLRIDPPGWDETALAPEVTPGKRCARLDLRQAGDRATWEQLLQGADVLVHGYRSDALEALGLGTARRQHLRPGLVDVSLDAYGFTGPWNTRRGFDSLVQMGIGIAEQGQHDTGADKPVPLPVQALDHANGYLMASAVLRALEQRLAHGRGSVVRASLARTGALLMRAHGRDTANPQTPLQAESPADWSDGAEHTAWGPARRLRWPLRVGGIDLAWDSPACTLGSGPASWR